jgi:hypothetical protein
VVGRADHLLVVEAHLVRVRVRARVRARARARARARVRARVRVRSAPTEAHPVVHDGG